MVVLITCHNTVIYVKPDKPMNTSQSCPEPCVTLFINASQLSDLLTSNTILKLLPGIHFIDQDIVVWNKTNVSFIGDVQGTEDVVHIACSENVSISFVNCSNVIVQDILFEHCGNFLDTSYMDTGIGENYWFKFPLALVPRAALIFVHCFATILRNLFITESPGFGVLGVNMLGNSRVHSVNIEYSGLFPCYIYSDNVNGQFAGGIFLLFQNTPNMSSNETSTFTLSDIAFLSSCKVVDFDEDITGSGIITVFGQNLYALNMIIENSTFDNNTANHHPGLNFIFYTGVSGTKLSIHNCSFSNNYVDGSYVQPIYDGRNLQGIVAIKYAALIKSQYLKPRASFKQLPLNLHMPNEMSITNCSFTNNTSYDSSGISFVSFGEDSTMKVFLRNIQFRNNIGLIASALMFLQQESPAFSTAFQVTMENCTFINNSNICFEYIGNCLLDYRDLSFRFISVVAFHNIRLTNLTGSTLFENNKGSSIFLYDSAISLNGTFEFIENYANIGAGLGIYGNSYFLVHEGTNISFINNVARWRGGAVYVGEVNSVPNALANICFFQYLSPQGNLDKIGSIDVNVYFANNSAGEAGNSIFITSSLIGYDKCSWLPNTAFQEALPTNITNRIMSFADRSRPQISTDHPLQVCFCAYASVSQYINSYAMIMVNISFFEAACSITPYPIPVYPGEIAYVAVVGIGEFYSPAPAIVQITVNESICLIDNSRTVVHQVLNNCTTLKFIVTSNFSGRCTLKFRTAIQGADERFLDLQILECPFGFVLNENGTCICHPLLISQDNPAMVTNCNLTSQMFRKPGNSWLHTVNNNGTLTEVIARSYCSFGYCNTTDSDLSLTNLDAQCLYKRSGTLCGQCKSGFSSVFGSPQCRVCSNVWLSLLIIFAIAGITLVVIIFVLNLTITSGTINGIIFYANVISINGTILFPTINTFHPLFVFISFLNLDLGIVTCFYDGMDEYAKVWLEYVFPVYLIVIVGVIIIMARYTSWAQRAVQSNGVPVLSTLLFLSYTKLLRNASTVLFYNVGITHVSSGRIEQVWAVDANIEYFGLKFTILFIVSLLIFLLIVIPFTFVMLFTKTFLRFKYVSHFKPMLDAYQSPFANPFRFWLGYRLLIRAFLFSISALDTQNVLLINSITLSGLAIMHGYFRPFNNFYCNLWDLSFLLNLATLFVVSLYFGEANNIMVSILVGISLVSFGALIVYHIIKVFDQHRMDCRRNSRIFLKMNTLLHKINTSLVNSDIYKHLAVTTQEPVRHKPTESSDEMLYLEMREPLVILDDN